MLVIFSALALSIVGNFILAERSWRTWDRLRCTRASITELLVGNTLPAYGLLLLQQAILLTYAVTVVGAHPTAGARTACCCSPSRCGAPRCSRSAPRWRPLCAATAN